MITIDFETRASINLLKVGTSAYARHRETHVLCLCYGRDPENIHLWKIGDPPPQILLEAIEDGETVEAHNVFFERNIWHHICHKRMGWPDIPADQWRCSLSVCSYLTLPRSLEGAGEALGLTTKKDKVGHRIMQRLCKPKKPSKVCPGIWDNSPVKFQRLYEYCAQDVRSEIAVSQAIGELPPEELKVWQMDQQINLRGLAVDRNALMYAMHVIKDSYERCCQEIHRITQGEIKTPKQVAAILSWIQTQMGEAPKDLTAETVAQWLERSDLSEDVYNLLQVRQDASKASTAKLNAMLLRCDSDGRVRGNLVYHGATTGRWAGSGIQIQNFPRGDLKVHEIDTVHELLPRKSCEAFEMTLGKTPDCISSSLRSMVCAKRGSRLLVCDFASIEARVLAWVADEHDLLDVFRRNGDVYKFMAAKIFSTPEKALTEDEITKDQRFVGKTATLGLGYGMGWRAFIGTCWRMAGVTIDSEMSKKVVKVYRTANSKIKKLWRDIGTSTAHTIATGKTTLVGRITISIETKDNRRWLKIQLPNGRKLSYFDPHLQEVTAPWSLGYFGSIQGPEDLFDRIEATGVDLGERVSGGWINCDVPLAAAPRMKKLKAELNLSARLEKKEPQMIEQIQFYGVDSFSKKWKVQKTYGAKLVENIVQAVSRDFLVEAIFRVEANGYPVVATIHDEVVCERKLHEGSLQEFEDLMREVPKWGAQCPIEVEGFEAIRYRK